MQRENKRFIIYYKELTHVVMEAEKSKICRADFWFEFKDLQAREFSVMETSRIMFDQISGHPVA